MSHTTLYEFRDGLPRAAAEFKNAWGSAAYVWNAMHERYLQTENYPTWMVPDSTTNLPLWELPRNTDLPLRLFERAVLASTFDSAIIMRRNFEQFAEHLTEFVINYPPAGKACHLLDFADFISISVADAIGFLQTSCGNNFWLPENEAGECMPYNIHSGKFHFEVYAWLKLNGALR